MKKRKRTPGAVGAKLRSRAGETIAETLVAVLIAAIAVLMLAIMLTSSTDLVHRSSEAFARYYAENNALSTRGATGGASGTAQLRDASSNPVYLVGDDDADVLYYVNGEAPGGTPVISYKYDP